MEYLFPEKGDELEDSEEQEFGNHDDLGNRTRSSDPRTSSPPELAPVELLELWEKTIAEEKTARLNVPSQPTFPNDIESAIREVEDMAKAYEYSSDAAFLENFQYGIPHLSGACRGFGFELTEEGGGFVHNHGNKLRLNENSRPYVLPAEACDTGAFPWRCPRSHRALVFFCFVSSHQSL